MALGLRVEEWIPGLIAEVGHHNHDNCQGEVSQRQVQDKHKHWLAADPRLVDGGQGGHNHQQVEQGLGEELDKGDGAECWPDEVAT